MWSITPSDVELAKEELKGRRAAIQARYEDETQKLRAELDDIEALERVATAFVQRHDREAASASVEPDPVAPPETVADAAIAANKTERSDDLWSDDHDEFEILSEAEASPVAEDASAVQRASSRWRIRV